jgi:large subunit ribosomal protein L9
MANLKVVLLAEVPKVGKIGDVASVTAGYARNFLLPRGLAVTASEQRLSNARFKRELESRRDQADRVQSERIAGLVQGQTIVITVTVGDQGRMHGQITNQDVARAVAEQLGVEIDRHTIQIDSPIRSLGRYLLPIRITSGLEASVTLEVAEQIEEPEAPPEAEAEAEAAEEDEEPTIEAAVPPEAPPAEDINPADFEARTPSAPE